jgi:phosphate transport system substrate-binding protein
MDREGHRDESLHRAGARVAALACGVIGLIALGSRTSGSRADDLPLYQPQRQVAGTIRIWGSPDDGWLIEELEAGFRSDQPRAQFVDTLHGPESTFASISMDVADMAFMEREIRMPLETMAFEWVHHYPPFELEIANDGLDADRARGPGVSLAFFVNKANPLSCLTLRELDDIFGARPRRGGKERRVWGDLGLGRGWAARPIHVYGPALDDISTVYVRRAVLEGSYKWNPRYRTVPGRWSELLETLARDPDGITFAPPLPGNEGVKPLRIAATFHSQCHPLNARTIESRQYPLVRTLDVALDRPPGRRIEPMLREFLRFILSRQGQRIIGSDGAYLPLDAASLRAQRRRLQ